MIDEDVLPIDLTLQRKSLPPSMQTPPSASIYICPVCSEEQLTLDHFLDHMTTHRWRKSPLASCDRSCLLLARSSLLKSSRRLKLLRSGRKRHRDSKRVSSIATTRSDEQPAATGSVEEEGQVSFHCPACPAFQRISGIQAAVPLLPSPPPSATALATTTGNFKSPQQLIDPVIASILVSDLLLSTHSTLFPGSASQNWKVMDYKEFVGNDGGEKLSQAIAESKSQTRDVRMATTKTHSNVHAQQQQQQHPQLSALVNRYSPNSTTPVILYDHPLQRLLPPHVAVALDRSTVAKICHYCFKEFADEMAVLKHQVLVHRLEETTAENPT
ncbi:hypothetical protein EGR_07854 [Echinococcus granulosus]|uniref:C2H2-type domain-containing protein n=1 Tax=Echinococcus granulosus TaxID=6210 RepID=W6U7W3_ECHGR|nr:hypothetical protein EGR_07854 [Echinococcus granulosus]EUB57318.1 hypothetical protein EGR_07854 [Echinococcus granulosus]